MLNAADAEAFLVARFGREVSEVSPIGQGSGRGPTRFGEAAPSTSSASARSMRIFAKTASPQATAPALCPSRPSSRSVRPVAASSRSRNVPLAGFSTISTKTRCAGCCRHCSPRSTRPGESISRGRPAMAAGARTAMLHTTVGARRCWPSRTTGRGSGRTAGGSASWPRPRVPGPFDEALTRLDALIPDDAEERHLIHSDLLNFNVLVADGRISAVIDWGCGMYGDFLYDLAWFEFWSPWYAAWRGIDFRQRGRAPLCVHWSRRAPFRGAVDRLPDPHWPGGAGL